MSWKGIKSYIFISLNSNLFTEQGLVDIVHETFVRGPRNFLRENTAMRYGFYKKKREMRINRRRGMAREPLEF